MALPTSWAEVMRRLARLVGEPEDVPVWLRQAVDARWGAQSFRDLDRQQRQITFQKACGVLYALQEHEGDLAFQVGCRHVVACAFARYFDGVALEGPPWMLDPYEDRPTYEQWIVSRHAPQDGVTSLNDTGRLSAPGGTAAPATGGTTPASTERRKATTETSKAR